MVMKRLVVTVILPLVLFAAIAVGCAAIPNSSGSTAMPNLAQPSPSSSVTPDSAVPPESVVDSLKAALANEYQLSMDQITLKQAEAVQWSNGCLDLPQPDEMCTMQIVPGYRVVMNTPQGEYVLHSNQTGSTMRVAKP